MMTELTLMAIGAHADDIELNVGGTLAKYRELGYSVAYVMATNNMSGCWHQRMPDGTRVVSRPSCREMMEKRRTEAAAGAAFFGARPIFLDHPQRHYRDDQGEDIELRYGCPRPECVPAGVPTILTAHEDGDAVRRLSELIIHHNPEAVLTHGPIMLDMEHVATSLLVTKAYRKAAESGYAGMLLHWLDISPILYGPLYALWETHVDVSQHQEKKLEAIGQHACQIPDTSTLEFPQWGNSCGCRHAEAMTIGGTGRLPPDASPFIQEMTRNRKVFRFA